MVFISVMVWICFYPGNRLHAVSLKVGLVMDDFGMHDRSYNQLAYQGLVQAEKELGIKGSAVSAAKEDGKVGSFAIQNQKDGMSEKV